MSSRKSPRSQRVTKEDLIGRPILVIEDQRSLAYLMKAMLQERWGCEVHLAHTLAETKELLDARKDYMVALCDLNLPDGEHGEVIDTVMLADIPSIAMTAVFGDELRESILKKGVVDYILKDSVNAYSYVCDLIGRLAKNRSIKVLAVDDSLAMRALLKQSLQMHGLQVLLAKDGEEGRQLIEQHPDIRVLLVDYYMPGMNGLELTRFARQKLGKDQLAIIGLSGSDHPMFSANFLKNGANDFIRKPFHFEELICRVNQNLEMLDLIEVNNFAANRDFLTGLFNRRYFFNQGHQRLEQPNRPPTHLAMIDVDFFKSVNDTHGHDCGDAILKMLAHQISSRFGEHLPARIGGEEFAILLTGVDDAAAGALIEALRQSVEANAINWMDKEIRVTISAGLAPVEDNELDVAMRRADECLYGAKSDGRNQVRQFRRSTAITTD